MLLISTSAYFEIKVRLVEKLDVVESLGGRAVVGSLDGQGHLEPAGVAGVGELHVEAGAGVEGHFQVDGVHVAAEQGARVDPLQRDRVAAPVVHGVSHHLVTVLVVLR